MKKPRLFSEENCTGVPLHVTCENWHDVWLGGKSWYSWGWINLEPFQSKWIAEDEISLIRTSTSITENSTHN